MAVTQSWQATAAANIDFEARFKPFERRREAFWLFGASLVVLCGLAFVIAAKTEDFPELQDRLNHGELLNLNQVSESQQVAAILQIFNDPGERELVAQRISSYLQPRKPVPNVGVLARLRVTQADLENDSRWSSLRAQQKSLTDKTGAKTGRSTLPLVPLPKIKPLVVVRTPREFLRTCAIWISLYVAAFWLVHFAWRLRRFRGDPAILPALHLLTGIGLILMISLRDPLRDTLEFKKFAWGAVVGCASLLLPLLRSFQYRNFSRWVYTPLLLAFALFVGLLRLGSGPTGSDAKVNLGLFQPVEVIKVLLVFFLAGYFAHNWERLRDLHPKRFVPRWLRWMELPRASHALPVMCAVSCALALFFLLKDMGPALVMGFVFLTMFAVARGRSGLALLGVFVLVCGVVIGYRLGAPHTVVERVSMWLSPWDNDVRGGDQLAHSLWAFATGGPFGSGPGWGDPSVIPAGHTDLVLPSIAEEWGLPGVLSVCILFALLVHRAFRIALNAPEEYAMFLAVGLGTLIALEMLLISGGALGAIPLSGVVSPFLSSGNTAMLMNFAIFAVLLGISNQSARARTADEEIVESGREAIKLPFSIPVRVVSVALAGCALALVGRAAYIEVLHDQELIAKNALVFTQDGVKRPQRNPRLNLLAASIPRGNIYDRNGLLLATSSWTELEKHHADYERLGISIDQTCSRLDNRHYPFGPATLHLLGDLRTGENFHATNASLIEHDSNARLQGYKDYAELAPVVRYRHQRGNPVLEGLLNRNRDVTATIDIRLQLKAAEILKNRLEPANKKGALVIMNPQSGDVLALVSWPMPPQTGAPTPDELLDRARYGQYPPGSTFKLVTAMAALRLDPKATEKTYTCRGLGDGRVGTIIPGWRRPVRDDIKDHAHGTLNMANAIRVSCNAYFAQLGVYNVGAKALLETADLLGIPAGELAQIRKMMPFAAYGQGPVLITPFKMARVAATIAAGGRMPEGRWVSDASNGRTAAPIPVLASDSALFLQRAMRSVVTGGTARSAMTGMTIDVAGKTGTAQLDAGDPHSWFAGFAPYEAEPGKQIAFAIVVEHGGYGALFAAPAAREIVEAAQQLGIITAAPENR
ncbi:MAG: FtsW/RodA/SpoVE family cell cycle protein [Acidobacteriaceae bacterium]|nr:FtsW/RodA/SpoVE family cell cycle protein [Acidobacteriaceae bacterium]MBV9296982.1 FtsW/RodA/SpoVE family cell cycle protein [Acidobacteriaceae bacterium]MBV9765600.1 FtsW/RodA/SpoVE family cell cycle protein [Acidobacteriaceae bacterium]